MRLYGNLMNRISESAPQSVPNIGDGATICMYSDRHAATIIEASDKRIVVQEDTAIRIDTNGMSESQSYRFEQNKDGRKLIFTLRKDGRFVEEGHSMKSPGNGIVIGHRSHYHDYSF